MIKINKKKYIVVSVRSYRGGPLALDMLCKLLEDKGCDARIFIVQKEFYKKKCSFVYMLVCGLIDYAKSLICKVLLKLGFVDYLCNRELFNKYCDPIIAERKRKILPCVSKDTIVVYSEIVRTNFLNATNVVKWLLYSDVNEYTKKYHAENELVICWESLFSDNPDDINNKIVCTSYFNKELYKQTNFDQRKGNCYCIRKGIKRDDLPEEFDGPIIDDLNEFDKVKAFNKYEKCYFYDMHTYYAQIAAICGCIPIYVLEKGKTKSDYAPEEQSDHGIAYGEDDIQYAISTRDLLIQEINDIDIYNEKAVNDFLRYIDEWVDKVNENNY